MTVINEFKKFALRGNLVDLAIGFTVGAAFTTIAKSLVNDIIMPPVGLVMGQSDFSDLFIVLKEGTKAAAPYATLADAQSAGAVTMNYGIFINNTIAFLVVAIVMFMVMRLVNRVDEAMDKEVGDKPPEPEEPVNKKCPYCKSVIAFKAIKCSFCTSDLEDEKTT